MNNILYVDAKNMRLLASSTDEGIKTKNYYLKKKYIKEINEAICENAFEGKTEMQYLIGNHKMNPDVIDMIRDHYRQKEFCVTIYQSPSGGWYLNIIWSEDE